MDTSLANRNNTINLPSPAALLLSCHHNDEEAALALLQAANVQELLTTADPSGLTPLLAAAKNGSPTILTALLHHGAKVAASLYSSGNTALHLAAAKGSIHAVQVIAQAFRTQGIPIDCRNSNMDSALMFAASAGHIGVVAALIKVRLCCQPDMTAPLKTQMRTVMCSCQSNASVRIHQADAWTVSQKAQHRHESLASAPSHCDL